MLTRARVRPRRETRVLRAQDILKGQKLQGTLTAKEVNHVLKMKGMEDKFPFFTQVYKISYEGAPVESITTTPYY